MAFVHPNGVAFALQTLTQASMAAGSCRADGKLAPRSAGRLRTLNQHSTWWCAACRMRNILNAEASAP